MNNYVKKTTTLKVYRESTLRKVVRLFKGENGRTAGTATMRKRPQSFSSFVEATENCETRCFAHFACLTFKKIFRKLE